MNESRKFQRPSTKKLLIGAALLIAAPAFAFGGGALKVGINPLDFGYIGALPAHWFADEPCNNGTITVATGFGGIEYQVDVAGVRDDGNANTYLQCTAYANLQRMTCIAGQADGTVMGCRDDTGPHLLPTDGDVVYMQFDSVTPSICNILIGTGHGFGVADPKCRAGGTGGSGGGPTVCDATTASATLAHSQSTSIASNACVRLKNEASWATIDPNLQATPGTAAYPVPFSYSSCSGTGTGAFTGNWSQTYLFNGQGAATNPKCDIFVKLQGDGSPVNFVYYE